MTDVEKITDKGKLGAVFHDPTEPKPSTFNLA
jgi:hypothetical protein